MILISLLTTTIRIMRKAFLTAAIRPYALVVRILFTLASVLPVVANTRTTVEQVTGTVTISDEVDYVITSSTPFADESVLDIQNTDHAAIILQAVKPSAALKLLSHITVKGETAKNNTNCQVKLYNRGAIILPYASTLQPLTVYAEAGFQGDASSDFGMGNTGGFMNTMTDAQLNNRVRSFKLKRGYMVTFSTLPLGRGYSRCFIAADADLEVAELPKVLAGRISSYRLFKWYDTGKQQLAAAGGDNAACSALNVTSTYSWNEGANMLPDVECVSHHIYEDWPSPSACGNVSYTPHMKTNNEPRNGSDDHPQDLTTILNNWENLMATGMRLCSPSSWDGSDYWNGTGFLKEFFDSIDARGWRCDILDMHCYWPENNFGNLKNWVDAVHRPIWISEWVWGASWNSNGAFASGITESQNTSALKRICPKLNAMDYLERYYYWNGERDPSRIYKNGGLTEAGKYYATINSGVGYKGKYDFVPTTPRQYNPSNFKVTRSEGQTVITWHDNNGEYNQLMELQRKVKGGQWETLAVMEQKEKAANYTYTDAASADDTQYRVHILDINDVDRYTNDAIEPGDVVATADGRTLYVGGNLLTNGGFDLGMQDWTSGRGATIAQPYFEVVAKGGVDGGPYLQAYGHGGPDHAASLKLLVDVEAGKDYYFRAASRKGGSYQNVSLSADGKESDVVATLNNSDDWQKQSFTFNSGQYTQVMICFRWLEAQAQFDQIELRQLFDTPAAAFSDGSSREQKIAEAAKAYLDEMAQKHRDSLEAVVSALRATGFPTLAPEAVEWYEAEVQPSSPDFKSTSGWMTKAGTYKDGDQRTNTVGGKTCWNAWWSNISASQGTKRTMEIRQSMDDLPEGIYALECKATTEHYCLSDQHGYLVYGNDTVNTPVLQADYFDLPVGDIWQTLTTAPIYVPKGGSVTIGFKSSKQGAVDNAWRKVGDTSSTGDKREGWWCATDFRLLYHPVYSRTTTAGEWGTLCLPYAFDVPEGLSIYQIAGYNADTTEVYIEEVKEPASGTPYIYHTTLPELRLYEKGTAKTTQLLGPNGLRGFLRATVKSPVGGYVLHDGVWYVVKERSAIPDNTALIYSFKDISVLDHWTGLSMKMSRIPWEETGIQSVRRDAVTPGLYTLSGRMVSNSESLPAGIYLKVAEGKTTKVVRR